MTVEMSHLDYKPYTDYQHMQTTHTLNCVSAGLVTLRSCRLGAALPLFHIEEEVTSSGDGALRCQAPGAQEAKISKDIKRASISKTADLSNVNCHLTPPLSLLHHHHRPTGLQQQVRGGEGT